MMTKCSFMLSIPSIDKTCPSKCHVRICKLYFYRQDFKSYQVNFSRRLVVAGFFLEISKMYFFWAPRWKDLCVIVRTENQIHRSTGKAPYGPPLRAISVDTRRVLGVCGWWHWKREKVQIFSLWRRIVWEGREAAVTKRRYSVPFKFVEIQR